MECSDIAQRAADRPLGVVSSVAVRRWGADRLWPFAALLITVFSAVSAVATALWNPRLMRVFQAPSGTVALFAQGVIVVVAECLLISLVLSAAKTLARSNSSALRWTGRLLMGVSGLALFVALLLIAVSWYLRAHRLDFVVPSLALSALSAPSSVLPLLTAREFLLLGAAAAGALAVSVLLLFAAPASSPRRLAALALICVGFALVPRAAAWIVPGRWMLLSQFAKLHGAVESELLPSVTLLWGPLLGTHHEPAPAGPMRLERRYDLNAYAGRIQRDVKRPNILVFVIESLRADAIRQQVGGRPVMRVVSGLADEGLEFTHAYAASNESSLSMSAMTGGVYPLKRTGRSTAGGSGMDAPGLADVLSTVYRTAFLTSADELWLNMIQASNSPRLDFFFHARSFRGPIPPVDPLDIAVHSLTRSGLLRGTLDDRDTTEALQGWVRKSLDADPARPFYAMVCYEASHYPYQHGFHVPTPFAPNELDSATRASLSFVEYPRELTGVMRNRYWNSLAYIDSLISGTLEMLRARGVLDNTVVIVTGDHGEAFWEGGVLTHGGPLVESTMRVGLVAWGARHWTRGEYAEPFGLVNLAPMVLDLARMPDYAGFQGEVPAGVRLEDASPSTRRRPVFVSTQAMAFEDALIAGRWKFVMGSFDSGNRLFDLDADPGEAHNLALERPEAASCLEQTLREFRARQLAYYRDPLMKSRWFPPRHDAAFNQTCESVLGR